MSSETSITKPPKLSKTSTKPPKRKRKRAVAIKAAEAGRPQPVWLRKHGHMLPPPTAPPTEDTFERPAALPRLLDKAEVCRIACASFPTLWSWMRQGRFPRSRAVAGRSMWLSTEIEAWMRELPLRRLKGDGDQVQP